MRTRGVRVLTYNVRSCRGIDGRVAPGRIAEVIAASGADVACLQELDHGRARTSHVHQAEKIAQTLTMHFDFQPAIRTASEEYGDAILSRHPLRVVRRGDLPRTPGALETRGALWAEIETEGARWQVLNTHLGLGWVERRAQARAFAEWVRAAQPAGRVLVCGDLNSRPRSAVHALLAPGWREVQRATRGRPARTFSTRCPWICLDYIYVSADVEILRAEVLVNPLTKIASDHFPLLADLR